MVISIAAFNAESNSWIADITIGLATLSAMSGGLFSGWVLLDHLPQKWNFMDWF
jgi:hypothetical protein